MNGHGTALLVMVSTLWPSLAWASPIDVVFFAGQSNAVGGGHVDSLPEGTPIERPEILYTFETTNTDSEGWGPLRLRPSGNGIPRWFGGEFMFGQDLADAGKNVAIIKFARNGTNLAIDWAPDGPVRALFYDFVEGRLQDLEELGYEPTVRSFLWVHGSGDAGNQDRARRYKSRIGQFVDEIRDRFDSPNMSVILNEYHIDSARDYVKRLIQSQIKFARFDDPFAETVNIDDLPLNSDFIHLADETQIELGHRMAEVYLNGNLNVVPEPGTGMLAASCIVILFVASTVSLASRRACRRSSSSRC